MPDFAERMIQRNGWAASRVFADVTEEGFDEFEAGLPTDFVEEVAVVPSKGRERIRSRASRPRTRKGSRRKRRMQNGFGRLFAVGGSGGFRSADYANARCEVGETHKPVG
jgi:hypothetical protein